jgi:carbon-monoxide dehydrogenase medium subunit
MKAAPFRYASPSSVAEAVALLASDEGAKPISGGQSLMPMMAFRLAAPTLLVDLRKIPDLDRIAIDANGVRLGARVRWRDILSDERLATAHPLLRNAISHVAHYQVRNRGTVGGSLAHADPAAEWCSAALVLGAQIVVRSGRGARSVPAEDFFLGFLTTALEPDELIVEVVFPRPYRYAGFAEFAQRKGDFALTSVAVALDVELSVCSSARIVVGGVADRPVRVPEAEAVLVGSPCDAAAFEAAAAVAGRSVDPVDQSAEMAPFRRHLTRTLTERALREAMSA